MFIKYLEIFVTFQVKLFFTDITRIDNIFINKKNIPQKMNSHRLASN